MIKPGAILEVKKINLIHNYKTLSKNSQNSLTGATIKANAYGLGDTEVFKILFNNGCRHFFVATIEEALQIRKKFSQGIIYVLNGLNIKEVKYIKYKNIIPVINSLNDLKNFKKIKIAIHIDTGINRLGIDIKKISKIDIKNYNIVLLLSHLASADEITNKYSYIQNKKFTEICYFFDNIKLKSLCNSSGIFFNKKFHHNLVRPGIALYGGHNNNIRLKNIIKPVIKLKARVIQIKNIPTNQFVGYNQTYKTYKPITVAILGIGYADGISRKLSNKGKVYYQGKKFNIIGRVSMDSITIDITKSKKIIKKDMYLEIINYKHDIEDLAKKCGTISNEILTSISKRVKRIYI